MSQTKQRHREYMRGYRAGMPEARKARQREAQKRYIEKHRKRLTRLRLGWNITAHYGIGLEEYDAMVIAQCGRCACCSKPMTGTKEPAVDHHHGTERVRALLCALCNMGLGAFRDSPELLERAASYLREN